MTLEAIGQKLKSAREAQGLSLRQIYERTKIPINHLQAIDGGQQSDLPEPVYVAGFIKRYAECIGLDGQVLADEFRRIDNEGNGNGKPKNQQNQPAYVTPEYLKHAKIDNSPPQYKLWFFPILIGIVIIGVLHWYTSQTNSGNTQQDPNLQSLKDSVSHIQQTPESGNTAQSNTASTLPSGTSPMGATGNSDQSGLSQSTKPKGPNSVMLSANKHVWVAVKRMSSGESLYVGFMEQGDQRQFDEPSGIRVTAGNGGSLSIETKGKIEPFGAPGKKTERTFSSSSSDSGATASANKSTSTTSTDKTSSASGSTSSTSDTSASATAKTTKKTTTSSATASKSSTTSTHSWPSDHSSQSNDSTHANDVPYRYGEGRLDSN